MDLIVLFDDLNKVITPFLAVYAAAVSTYAVWLQRRTSQPLVRVRLSWQNISTDGVYFPVMLNIQLANAGVQKVTLYKVLLKLVGSSLVSPLHETYPTTLGTYELEPGQVAEIRVEPELIGDWLARSGKLEPHDKAKIMVEVEDGAGRHYTSSVLDFSLRAYHPDERRRWAVERDT